MALSADTNPVEVRVLDVETTMQHSDPDWVHAANRVVLWGILNPDKASTPIHWGNAASARMALFNTFRDAETHTLIVGHNLAFDIGYCIKEGVVTKEELATRTSLWDTMFAEYLLSGQLSRFISLDDLCLKYDIPFTKDTAVTDYFSRGMGADKVPPHELALYNAKDISVTHEIFKLQWQRAEKECMLPLILMEMDFLSATIDMRVNGVYVDDFALKDTTHRCEEMRVLAEVDAKASMLSLKGQLKWELDYDACKTPQLANLLFGHDYKESKTVEVGKYKNGKPKLKVEQTLRHYNGILKGLVPEYSLLRSADEATLEKIMAQLATHLSPVGAYSVEHKSACDTTISILRHVMAYRKATKILSTYCHPTELDIAKFGKLHPKINVVATATGRTSCSGPNLQNVPKNDVSAYRSCIVACRPDRQLAEFDYKQLEVLALAVATKDSQLISDLRTGVDMHTKLYQATHGGRTPSILERRKFKRAVFALIYGGGATAIAEQGEMRKTEATKLLKAWELRYPTTLKFRATTLSVVEASSIVNPIRKFPLPHRIGWWISMTGRKYTFEQRMYDRNFHVGGKPLNHCDWNKQEIANYPIQGLATADMVPLMIGGLYRFIYAHDFMDGNLHGGHRPRMVMAVHDSVLLDIPKSGELTTCKIVKDYMETLPAKMQQVFGLDTCGLSFDVEVAVGKNWADMVDILSKEK